MKGAEKGLHGGLEKGAARILEGGFNPLLNSSKQVQPEFSKAKGVSSRFSSLVDVLLGSAGSQGLLGLCGSGRVQLMPDDYGGSGVTARAATHLHAFSRAKRICQRCEQGPSDFMLGLRRSTWQPRKQRERETMSLRFERAK